MNGNLHGGEYIVSNLEGSNVGIVKDNFSDEGKEAVETAEEKTISGKTKSTWEYGMKIVKTPSLGCFCMYMTLSL